MRWTLRIVGALALAWLLFLASPFLALHSLGRAIAARDVEAVRERVNFRALRLSLMRQVLNVALEERGGRALGATERQLAAEAGAAVADPIVSQLLTPEAVIELLNGGWPEVRAAEDAASVSDRSPPARPGRMVEAMRPGSLGSAWRLFRQSELRGFRNMLVRLPPDAPADDQVRLRLRLVRTTWRLVGIELPEAPLKWLIRERVAPLRRSDGAKPEARPPEAPAPEASAPEAPRPQ
ncbi:MAG TPA: DUF2939 domain-containing protein [Beijerinckiaceae bacterium]|jgi:hypothetical protein